MEKFDFKDLEYIVMEGGGARGSAYLGAIIALEKRMWEMYKSEKNTNATGNDKIYLRELKKERKPGLLDYFRIVIDKETHEEKIVPVIKGIAGSSAGGITTFALSLGFNSEEIGEILKYDFNNFLSEIDAGKYRMITREGELAIGEDEKDRDTGGNVLSFSKKFNYTLTENKTRISGNFFKLAKRRFVFSLIINTLTTGIDGQLKQLTSIENQLEKMFPDEPGYQNKTIKGLYNFFVKPTNAWGKKISTSTLLNLLIFKLGIKGILKSPIDLSVEALTNVVTDRGMYSGFAVREFFLDMMLMALTKDTVFHEGFINLYVKETPSIRDKREKVSNYYLKRKLRNDICLFRINY